MAANRPDALHALCMLALACASQSAMSSGDKQSLQERRLGVIKGTTPGILILDLGSAKAAAPAVAASAAVEGRPAEAASQADWRPKWLSNLPPPSGRSLNAARRLDAPDQGIPVPTAASASQPAQGPSKP